MDNRKDIIDYILNNINKCTILKNPEDEYSIYFVYDKKIERIKKLHTILDNDEVSVFPDKESKVLFLADYKRDEFRIDIGFFMSVQDKFDLHGVETINNIFTHIMKNYSNILIPTKSDTWWKKWSKQYFKIKQLEPTLGPLKTKYLYTIPNYKKFIVL